MKKTKKALASLAIASMALTAVPFNVFAAGTVPIRLAGVTAEQTAVQIADQTGYTGVAILASSTSYGMVDALTAGPLAASLKAPILLTGAGNMLDAATKAELTKLAVKTVYVTSGTAVIKQGVLDELVGMGITVVPLGGMDRSETSVNIAKKMTGVTKVAVANGLADALSIASVAAAANEPILLTNKDALPSSVSAYIASAGVTASDVIGGTGVISDAVKAALPGATRHAGMTAYDTNNQVIQDFASSLEFGNVYVANGATGIDALAGAPLAAQTKSAIVLTDGKTVPAAAAFTFSKSTTSSVVTALGGEYVVPESVRAGVAAGQVTPVSNELKIVSVSALDDANSVLEVTFSKAVTKLETSDVAIQNANTLARYGVKSVVLNSSGLIATVELYKADDASQENPVLAYVTNYTVTVSANGMSLKTTFNRPAYVKERITDVDPANLKIKVGGVTVNIPKTVKFDYGDALGRKARVWYNSDRDLVNIAYEDETVVAGGLEITDDRAGSDFGEIEINDTKYDVAETGFKFYLNDESATFGNDGDEYDYARVFFNKTGEVELIEAYNWDDYLIVSEVDETVAISFDDTELDLEDYILVKDGKQISVSDLKKGDIVYFDADSNEGDGFAVVYNKSVSGEIEDVYSKEIRIDGTTYNFDGLKYGKPTQYLDGDDFADVDSDVAEEFQAGGNVTLFLDHKGDAVYLTGDQATVDSNSSGFHLTDDSTWYDSNSILGRGTLELDGVNGAGEEKSYTFRIDTLDKITNSAGVKYEVDKAFPTKVVKIDKFALSGDKVVALDADEKAIKADGTVDANWVNGYAVIDLAASVEDNDFIELKTNDSGTIVGLEILGEQTFSETGDDALELSDKFIDGYKLNANTVVFDGSAGWDSDDSSYDPDADDITVTTWGALKDKGFKIYDASYYVNSDDEVDYLVIKHSDAEDTTDFNAVVTKVLRNTDGEIVQIVALLDGVKNTYTVDEVDNDAIVKGSLVTLSINDDDGVVEDVNIAGSLMTGVVTNVSVADRAITISGANAGTYKLTSDGSVLNAEDTGDILVKALRDIDNGDTVRLSYDEEVTNTFVDVVEIVSSAAAPVEAPSSEGTVTYVNGSGTRFAIGSDIYVVDANTTLYDADGGILEIGTTDVTGAINGNDVDDIVVVSGVVKSLRIATDLSVLEADIATAEAADEADYAPASWTALQDALEEATALDADSTQSDVDDAVTALEAAIADTL